MSKQVYVYGDYLMHHGIKGQEWGVQNGPPYPLNPVKDYSPAEKKVNPGGSNKDPDANDDESLEKKYGVTIERTNKRFGDDYEYQAASVKKTNVKSGQATVNGKDVSKALEDKDHSAMDDVDSIGCKALQIYSKNGMSDTLKYLNDNLKNVNYSIQFFNEKYDSGEEYPMFQLEIIDGNKNGYSTYGEFDYTDDQFFFTDDVKLKHFSILDDINYLMHYGVLGQKWGVRRYQNEDGTLTPAGKKRYNNDSDQVAMKTAVKYEALADLNDKKSKAEQALGKNPWKFNNSIERKQYLESMQKAQKAFDDANSVVNDMVKKYKDVKVDILTEKETGEQYVQSILETKLGDKYISEFYLGAHVAK